MNSLSSQPPPRPRMMMGHKSLLLLFVHQARALLSSWPASSSASITTLESLPFAPFTKEKAAPNGCGSSCLPVFSCWLGASPGRVPHSLPVRRRLFLQNSRHRRFYRRMFPDHQKLLLLRPLLRPLPRSPVFLHHRPNRQMLPEHVNLA